MTPALTFEEWSKGTNKNPLLEGFDPAKLQENIKQKIQSSFTFNKKPGAGSEAVALKSAAGSGSAQSAAEIAKLQKDVDQQKSVIIGHE